MRRLHAEAQSRALDYEAQALRRQIDHIQNDPDYVMQLVHDEFGLSPPGAETILVAPTDPVPDLPPPEPSNEDVDAMRTTARIEAWMAAVPLLRAVATGPLRYPAMALAGVLLLCAVTLLGRSPRPPAREAADDAADEAAEEGRGGVSGSRA